MKYTIISDIHGNIHAFNAVLEDATAQGTDCYLRMINAQKCRLQKFAIDHS